ncbi:hypothetical protein N6H14_03635 [Paenibacillus sp. CC-CFT747]|nr:hypothetical protein N6H14_03635 [Paenibacillus sp. CC-CFT747]
MEVSAELTPPDANVPSRSGDEGLTGGDSRLASFLVRLPESPVTDGNEVEVYTGAETAYPAIQEAMEGRSIISIFSSIPSGMTKREGTFRSCSSAKRWKGSASGFSMTA